MNLTDNSQTVTDHMMEADDFTDEQIAEIIKGALETLNAEVCGSVELVANG
jgi:hypothetical protein